MKGEWAIICMFMIRKDNYKDMSPSVVLKPGSHMSPLGGDGYCQLSLENEVLFVFK